MQCNVATSGDTSGASRLNSAVASAVPANITSGEAAAGATSVTSAGTSAEQTNVTSGGINAESGTSEPSDHPQMVWTQVLVSLTQPSMGRHLCLQSALQSAATGPFLSKRVKEGFPPLVYVPSPVTLRVGEGNVRLYTGVLAV